MGEGAIGEGPGPIADLNVGTREVYLNDIGIVEARQTKSEKEYIPPRQELLKRWSVNINFHDVGCTVQVGCKSIAFDSIDKGLAALNEYIKNPYQSEIDWREKFNQ